MNASAFLYIFAAWFDLKWTTNIADIARIDAALWIANSTTATWATTTSELLWLPELIHILLNPIQEVKAKVFGHINVLSMRKDIFSFIDVLS